jgi:hypothetical protein
MKKIAQGVLTALLASASLLGTGTQAAEALVQAHLCVFDPLGQRGDAFKAARDLKFELQEHGVDFDLRPYTDERVAVEDFRTGQCDAVMATALRTRAFNSFAASLDAVGASTIVRNGKVDIDASYDVVRRFIQMVSLPKAADLMTEGTYEVGGILPLGAAYMFFSDKDHASIQGMVGQKIGAFDHDKAEAQLIQRMGARPVPVDVSNFGAMFNNHNVDAIVAPTIVYQPFELYRGIGAKGGVLRMPMTIATYQLVLRPGKLPKGLGQYAREYMARNFDLAMATLKFADKDVAENLWIDMPPHDADRYTLLMRQGRVLMAEKGFYDKKGLKLVKKIRCTINPSASECTEPTEEW